MKIKSFAILLSGIALTVGAAVSGGLIYSNSNSIESNATTTYSHTIEAKTWSAYGAQTLSGVSWTAAATGGAYWGYDATKGQQFGSGSSPAKPLTLTTSGISGTISSISISTSGASSVAATLGVSVAGSAYGGAAQSITSSNATYTFTGSAAGEIVLTWTQTSSKALYLKAIQIEYTSKVLTSIAVSGTLAKTAYYVGDSFESSGLTITANYDDLSTEDVTSECTFSPNVLTEGLTSVTATYVEGEVTKTAVIGGITVSTRSVVSISVLTNPTKMSYTIGQSFNPAGMIIRATYSAGPTNDNYSAYTYAPTAAFDSLGTKTVTITSTDNVSATTSVEITVVDKVEGTYGITSGATVYTSPMDPALLVINKSDSNLPSIAFSDISANVRLFGSPITGSIMIGNGSTSGGSFKMTLESGLYVSKIEFIGNDKDTGAAGTATLSVNSAAVNFSDITAEGSVILKPYANSITITTTARLWVEQIVITANFASTSANDYGTHFLSCTSGECLAGNVSSATWANLQSIYANADVAIKDLIKAAVANQGGTDLEHAIARYGVIVEKYGYTDFLALGYASVGNIYINNGSNAVVLILVSGTALLAGVSFIYFFLKKKKHN